MDKAKEAQYRELAERIDRQAKLGAAAGLLQTERNLQVRPRRLVSSVFILLSGLMLRLSSQRHISVVSAR